DADSQFLEGKMALSQGNIPAAREAFRSAAKLAPEQTEYRSFVAWTDFLEGAALVELALQALQDASAADASDMRAPHFLGLAAERLGNLADAKAAFAEAARRAPGNPEVQNALARLTGETG
ncbi:MAG: tetratricopeptide repeat protein, partial [Myxococcota bacterium]